MQNAMSILRGGRLRSGESVRQLEQTVCSITGAGGACALSNCTAGLYLSLQFADVRGGEVIAPSYTHISTISSIVCAGAKPVLVDVDEVATIDPLAVENAMSSRTKAVVAVHMYGQAADAMCLSAICAAHGVHLIEDCAYSIGTMLAGLHTGRHGLAGVFSFGTLKPIACGEGGILVSDNPSLIAYARTARNYGLLPDRRFGVFGLNWKLSELSAALLIGQCERLATILHRKQQIAEHYRKGISGFAELVESPPNRPSNRAFTVIKLPMGVHNSDVVRAMALRAIEVQAVQPVHMTLPSSCARICALPRTELYSENLLCLPSHLRLRNTELSEVSRSLVQVLKEPLALAQGIDSGH